MKRPLLLIALLGILSPLPAPAEVVVDVETFGTSLGGWIARKGRAAEYELSEASYRTYQPEVSPSPDGGIFISVRIDHRRGFFASDDHASLELSFGPDGTLVSAQSSLALQGRTISSELIKGGASASTSVAAPQIDRAVKVGTDLVADLTSKLLREKIVEPGRVSFPAAIRHNYNLLYKAVKYQEDKPEPPAPETAPEAAAAGTSAAPGMTSDQKPGSATPPPPANPSEPPAPASSDSQPKPPASTPGTGTDPDHLVPSNKVGKDPKPAAAEPPKPAPTPAQTPSTTTPQGKTVPLPEIKAYNPSGAPSTPLPASSTKEPAKEKSLLMEHGGEVLKLARDVVKTTAQ